MENAQPLHEKIILQLHSNYFHNQKIHDNQLLYLDTISFTHIPKDEKVNTMSQTNQKMQKFFGFLWNMAHPAVFIPQIQIAMKQKRLSWALFETCSYNFGFQPTPFQIQRFTRTWDCKSLELRTKRFLLRNLTIAKAEAFCSFILE